MKSSAARGLAPSLRQVEPVGALTRVVITETIPLLIFLPLYGSVTPRWAPEQRKPLFAPLGSGSAAGAGAQIAGELVPFGPQASLGSALFLLIVCGRVLRWENGRAPVPAGSRTTPLRNEALAEGSAFPLLIKDEFPLLIAALALLINWVYSNGEYIFERMLLAPFAHGGPHVGAMTFGKSKADYALGAAVP